MTSNIRYLVVGALVPVLTGCSALGTVLIGRDGRSLATKDAVNKIGYFESNEYDLGGDRVDPKNDPPNAEDQAIGTIAAMAIPILLNAVQKGIETEAKRYKATYSAQDPLLLPITCDEETRQLPVLRFFRKAKLRPNPLVRLLRWIASKESESENVVVFDVRLDFVHEARSLRLRPELAYVGASASKVASWSLWPWQLPATIVWTPWYLFDRSIAEVDMNVQITLDLVTESKAGGKLVSLGSHDFPIGKFALPTTKKRAKLKKLDSLFIPMPTLKCEKDDEGDDVVSYLATNATVTVIEANDLGDVLAKGAEKFKDEKSGFGDKLKEWLGSQ